MKRILLVGALALFLGGCETVTTVVEAYTGEGGLGLLKRAGEVGGVVEDKTLGNAMKALPYYCKLPLASRAILRNRANARPEAGGAKIAIWCPTDPMASLGGP